MGRGTGFQVKDSRLHSPEAGVRWVRLRDWTRYSGVWELPESGQSGLSAGTVAVMLCSKPARNSAQDKWPNPSGPCPFPSMVTVSLYTAYLVLKPQYSERTGEVRAEPATGCTGGNLRAPAKPAGRPLSGQPAPQPKSPVQQAQDGPRALCLKSHPKQCSGD